MLRSSPDHKGTDNLFTLPPRDPYTPFGTPESDLDADSTIEEITAHLEGLLGYTPSRLEVKNTYDALKTADVGQINGADLEAIPSTENQDYYDPWKALEASLDRHHIFQAWQCLPEKDIDLLQKIFGVIVTEEGVYKTQKITRKEIAYERNISYGDVRAQEQLALTRLKQLLEPFYNSTRVFSPEKLSGVWEDAATKCLQLCIKIVIDALTSNRFDSYALIKRIRIYKTSAKQEIESWPSIPDSELWINADDMKKFVHVWSAAEYLLSKISKQGHHRRIVDFLADELPSKVMSEVVDFGELEQLDNYWRNWRKSYFRE